MPAWQSASKTRLFRWMGSWRWPGVIIRSIVWFFVLRPFQIGMVKGGETAALYRSTPRARSSASVT